jgi:HSP20 family protein
MPIIRWNPSTDLLNLHSELDRVFNDVIPGPAGLFGDDERARAALLPVDIRRDGDQLVIEAPAPGFDPNEVRVTVDGGVLTIDAHHEQEKEDKNDDYLRKERFSGRLFRQVSLPVEVIGDKAQASFKDGMLVVRAPLSKKTEPKRIPVTTEATGSAGKTRRSSSKADRGK